MLKELLFSITRKDLQISYFSGRGAGGQYRNRHLNCVRLKHIDSGVIVTGQSHRSRHANLKEALNNLIDHPHFKLWHTRRVNEILHRKSLEEKVQALMHPDNLLIEVKDTNGRWVPLQRG